MELEQINGLRADLVPHRQWAVSKWFYANYLWYYHRLGTDEEVRTGRNFYKLVDEQLRELCHLLHEAGVHTTPSCQGHFYKKEHFEKVWEELTREAALIRNLGLKVTDSETQKDFLFLDWQYGLPWETFETFHDQAGAQQGVGYLGMIVPSEREDLRDRMEAATFCDSTAEITHDRILSRLLHGEVYNIFVRAAGPGERDRKWKMITNLLGRALERMVTTTGDVVETAGSFWNMQGK